MILQNSLDFFAILQHICKMKRYLYNQILEDLKHKMVFITGPRQVGKTYISKQILNEFETPQYLNFDNIFDRKIITEMSWKLNTDLLVFDEIHKLKNWKLFLKGIFDSKPKNQSILVTGSARLETFRQSGESLAGRYLHLHLNPFSVKELKSLVTPYEAIETLNKYGGFPEPLLYALNNNKNSSLEFAARWKNQYYTDLIREDIFEYSRISEIHTMKHLLELLRNRVGSPISYKALSEDLQVSPNTVKKYVQILESLYIIFLIRPFHKNIARAILKEPKVYFYDTSYVNGNEGIKFENTCAVSLLKHVQFLSDTKGKNIQLNYLRNKEKKEIDFVIVENGQPTFFIEVKLSNKKLSPSLIYFSKQFIKTKAIQLVHNLRQEENKNGIELLRAADWFAKLSA